MKFANSFFRRLAIISKEFYDFGRVVTYSNSSYSRLALDYRCEVHNTDFGDGNREISEAGSIMVKWSSIVSW